MDLFVILEEKINLPIAIFNNINEAHKYMYSMPSKHLFIYQYKLNEIKQEIKIADSYFIHGLH